MYRNSSKLIQEYRRKTKIQLKNSRNTLKSLLSGLTSFQNYHQTAQKAQSPLKAPKINSKMP